MGDIVAFVFPAFNARIVLPRYRTARCCHFCAQKRLAFWFRNASLGNEFVKYLVKHCVRQQQGQIEEAFRGSLVNERTTWNLTLAMAPTAKAGNASPPLSYRSKNGGVRDHDAQLEVARPR